MKFIILVLALVSQSVFADEWFCSTESGQRSGDTILACGVGEGMLEQHARKLALANALDEFQTICQASTECRNRTTSMEPKRLSCSKDKQGIWKCYRLIAITLGSR